MELGAVWKLAFAMISHPRLGRDAHGAGLEDEIVRLILEATLEENRVALPRKILRDCAQWGQLPFEKSWGRLIHMKKEVFVSQFDYSRAAKKDLTAAKQSFKAPKTLYRKRR